MTTTESARPDRFLTPEALIDCDALRHNLHRARAAAPHSRTIAVIKSNAYGHGMLRVASALSEHADAFGLARIEEAVALRQAGHEKPLLVLEGFFDAAELEAAIEHRIDLVISRSGQIDLLERCRTKRPLNCWLKVDSGMHRLGFQPQAAVDAHRQLTGCANVAPQIGLMSHFACADEPENPANRQQMNLFRPVFEALGGKVSMANSAAILSRPDSHLDWIRPGIMLYGASPMMDGRGAREALLPVMTLRSRLIAINVCEAGADVGYGATWRAPETMPVGVVAIGYGDGYPRHAPCGTPVLINGRRVPLVGRVSMDMVTVDLRTLPDAGIGDPVTLWGEGLAAEEIAQRSGTIAYELFCGVTQRVRFSEVNRGGTT